MMLAVEIYFETFIQSLMAFAAFSLLASAVYVLNDLIDLESDRSHPRKKNRPIASGSVSFTYAHVVIILLIGLSTVPSILLGKYFCIILMTYFFLTALYSCYIKRLIAIDVCILACLYTIRIIGGGAATNIDVSVWLLAFSIFLFLSLAAIKRQGELVDLSNRGLKKVEGRGYEVGDLTIINILSLCAGYLSVLIMALYLDTLEASMLFAKPSMLWGLCVVHLYWITRLVLITNRGQMDDDPIIFALKDNISKFCVFACLIFIVLAIN